MLERLAALAKRVQAQPWNRPGVDKTWVLRAMWEHQAFQREVRGARRVAPRFLDLDDETILRRIVQKGASLSAHHPEAGQFDVMLSVSRFSYAELADDATSFRVAGVDVRVGKLEKLLRSKQSSGRPKDLEFLRIFEARASESEDE